MLYQLRRIWRRSHLRKTLVYSTASFILRLLDYPLSRLSLASGRRLGSCMGYLCYILLYRQRRTALENLAFAFPNFSDEQLRSHTASVFQNLGMTTLEWLIIRRWSPSYIEQRFPQLADDIREFAEEIRRASNGVIGISAHIGNWEMVPVFFGALTPGLLQPVARRHSHPRMQKFFEELRAATGTTVIYTDKNSSAGRKRIESAVQQGIVPGFVLDQTFKKSRGMFVQLFGRETYANTFPVALARKNGARMFFGMIARDGSGFALRYKMFDVPKTANEQEDIMASTQYWTSVLEQEIRRDISQWMWTYPHWESTPQKIAEKQKRKFDHYSTAMNQ